MSRTTPTIRLKNNGTLVGTSGFNTFDLLGTLSAADSGNGLASITGSGGGAGTNVATEVLTAIQSGSNITLDLTGLAHTFVAVEVVFRNGQAISPSSWSVVGSTLTVTGADASESFMVQYTY